MCHVILNFFHISIFILTVLPMPALAMPTITCHCFTDRSYNPAQPSLADQYFLATAQNSFFAITFSTEKRSIVMKKQQGTPSDDLWIAYWVASKTGTSPDILLQARNKSGSWKNTIATQSLSPKVLGARVSNAL